jgi:hypothetical protein
VLLTRAPLYSWYCYHFLVRLACVRHAASVDSEPGSNSRLKPDVVSLRRRSNGDRPFPHSPVSRQGVQGTLLVRMIKPNLIHSHNWHVQPSCQRSVRAFRLSGALLDRGPGCYAKVSSNLMRMAKSALCSTLGRFCANFLNLSNFLLYVNHLFSSHLYPVGATHPRCRAVVPRRDESKRFTPNPVRISFFRAAQNFQTATSIARAARGSRRISPRVLQWLVL